MKINPDASVYRVALPVLALWLSLWLIISWAGVQDDSLIHLRYANMLSRVHFVSFDGIHHNYGASSLLYLYLMTFLTPFVQSPNLPHGLSSAIHVSLFAIIALFLVRYLPSKSSLARILGLMLLSLSVAPSAVRWLDDGMETGLVLIFVISVCLVAFHLSNHDSVTPLQYFGCTTLAFLIVILRIELVLLCGIAFFILLWKKASRLGGVSADEWFRPVIDSSHFLIGAVLAFGYIFWTTHALLPDTAIAKADGLAHWRDVLSATVQVLGGGLSFALGAMFLWVLTLFLIIRLGQFSAPVLAANILFPTILVMATLRGQQVQGARYFVWTFFFSSLWNILEIGFVDQKLIHRRSQVLTGGLLVLLVIALPFESLTMYRVLEGRARTINAFETHHLDVLQGEQGIASDVGYIAYFSKANICDLAGLVNGREQARRDEKERAQACVASHPDFLFLNLAQADFLNRFMDLRSWQKCNAGYDFVNIHSPDTHYLLLPASKASALCRRISNSVPSPVLPWIEQDPH